MHTTVALKPLPRDMKHTTIALTPICCANLRYKGTAPPPTPNIDSLANGGVRLESYYVNKLCSPTRTALQSGRYAYTIGMDDGVIVDGGFDPFRVSSNVMAQVSTGCLQYVFRMIPASVSLSVLSRLLVLVSFISPAIKLIYN